MLTTAFIIPTSHPSLPGHFPGGVITPGVVILDHVARGLISQLTDMTLDGFPQVKFLKPLLPDTEVVVTYEMRNETLYQFSCKENDSMLLTCQIKLHTDMNSSHG